MDHAAGRGARRSPTPSATRSPDLVNRDFTTERPVAIWVADFTYVRCDEGTVVFSFVIDVYSRRIVGWQLASHMRPTSSWMRCGWRSRAGMPVPTSI